MKNRTSLLWSAVGVLAVVGVWACSNEVNENPTVVTTPGTRTNPGDFPGIDDVSENLAQLASACTFTADGGVVAINLSAGEYALIARGSLNDGGQSLNVNGTPCGNATPSSATRINITGSPDGGSETVVIDYLGGTFALGSASSVGINIDLKNGASDALKIRGSSGVDNVLLATTTADAGSNGVYAIAVGINGTTNPGVKAISFTGVEALVVSTGPGDDVLRTAGQADAGVGGTPYGRTLSGTGPSVTFYGGDDNDTLNGGSGKTGSAVTFAGGAGSDTADFSARTNDVSCTIGGGAVCGETSEGATIGTDVEVLSGGAGNDTLVCAAAVVCTVNGNAGDDAITGGGFDDTLNGGAGDDTIIPGGGDDTVNCGSENDTISYSDRSAAVTVVLGTGGAASTSNGDSAYALADGGTAAENDSITACENMIGGSGADTLTGNDFDNVITGGAGADTMSGGTGNDTFMMGAASDGSDTINGQGGEDTVSYGARSAAVTVTLNTSTATTTNGAASENDSIVNVENVICGSGADTVTGDSANNRIEGGGGNDTIDSAAGDDVIDPGAGTNAVTCGAGNDILLPGGTTTNSAADCEL
ncbi:MAG: calcium-binding protein [Archangium sp.]|nr:calcium-binding protein [Archangium sp.]